MSKRKRKTTIDVAEITFIGGNYNKRTLVFTYPTPKYLLMSFGSELYVRQDPEGVVDSTYVLEDDWTEYNKYSEFRKEHLFTND